MALKVQLHKLTIVAERILRDELIALLKQHGASGWTLAGVEGEGSRGVRASEWEGSNVQIDTLVAPDVADAILAEVAERYFADWAIIAYVTPAEVLRGEKYVRNPRA